MARHPGNVWNDMIMTACAYRDGRFVDVVVDPERMNVESVPAMIIALVQHSAIAWNVPLDEMWGRVLAEREAPETRIVVTYENDNKG